MYDVAERAKNVLAQLDKVKDLVEQDKIDSMIVMFRTKTGEHARLMMAGQTSMHEWLGALQVTSAMILESIRVESEHYGEELPEFD